MGFAAAVAFVFCLHVYTLFSQYLADPTVSSFVLLDDNPPNLPAITLCPSKPFPAEVLVRMGINTSCDTREECISALEEADGLPEDLSLQELWTASLLPVSSYVESSSLHEGSNGRWKVSMTHLGPCWTLVPPALEQGEPIKPLSLTIKSQIPCSKYVSKKDISEVSCEKIEEMCSSSCAEEKLSYYFYMEYGEIFIMHHSPHEPPSILDSSNLLVIDTTTSTDLSIVTWFSVRKIHMLNSNRCIADYDYKFTECISLCSEKELLKKIDFQSLSDLSQMQNKSHIRQFLRFRRHLLTLALANGKDELIVKCKKYCKQPCAYTQYSFATKLFPDYYIDKRVKNKHYLLQASALYTESVTEERIYTMSKFLADLGGSLGLCFGASLLTLCHGVHRILNTLLKSQSKSSEEGISTEDEFFSRESHPCGIRLSCLRNIWIMCGTCLCLMAFTVHFLKITVNYLEYPTVFVTNLVRSPPPFPEVTLCPDFPFDLPSLTQYGLEIPRNSNVYEEYRRYECDRNTMISYIMNFFPGLWKSNLTLESMWNFKRPFHDTLKSFSYDNILDSGKIFDTVTTMGNCYTLSPRQSDVKTVLLDIALLERIKYISREIRFLDCLYDQKSFSYNVTFLLHPIQSPPLALGEFAITYKNKDFIQLGLEIRATTSKRISRPRATCREEPYSRKTCIDLCLLEDNAKEVGCRLPYLPASNLPLCDNSDQYARSIKGIFLETNKAKKECLDKCVPECNKVYYSLKPLRRISEDKQDGSTIKLKQQTSANLELVEQLKTSISTYLCEIGGILGLYMGMSLLDVMSWLVWMVRNFFKQVPLIGTKTKFHLYKLFQITWWLFISAILAGFSLSRFQDFFFNPKVYTKYSATRHTWKDFPGITLCRWPPFNLTSLESLGIDLYIKEMCGKSFYSNNISCDSNLIGFMNTFPGLENISVLDVWETASWNLSDILHSYTIHGVSHLTGTSDPHWVPVTTALNQCYRFVPPGNKENLSDVDLFFNHYNYKFRFKHPPTLLQSFMWLINGIFSPHNLIMIHSPQDKPLFNDDVFNIPLYITSAGYDYTVTAVLTEIIRLKGAYLGCQGGTYSTFNCVEQCLLEAIMQQQKCRLPFGPSSSNGYCNATSYSKFPKYLDKIASKLDNYSSVKKACMSECPLECNSYSYLVDEAATNIRKGNSAEYVKVTVTMGERTHDVFQEVPALSFASFLAEVGGVAGILSGMSLLMLSRFLQEGLARLYPWVRSSDGERVQ